MVFQTSILMVQKVALLMGAPVEPRNARPYLSTCVTPRPRHKRVLCVAASCIDVHCNTLNDKKSMLALFL